MGMPWLERSLRAAERIDQMWIVIHPLVRRRRDDFNNVISLIRGFGQRVASRVMIDHGGG